jgi:hypothetical protein
VAHSAQCTLFAVQSFSRSWLSGRLYFLLRSSPWLSAWLAAAEQLHCVAAGAQHKLRYRYKNLLSAICGLSPLTNGAAPLPEYSFPKSSKYRWAPMNENTSSFKSARAAALTSGSPALHRPWQIRQVGFRHIMQKPEQLQVRWQEVRNSDGMLCDTEEKTTLPSESAVRPTRPQAQSDAQGAATLIDASKLPYDKPGRLSLTKFLKLLRCDCDSYRDAIPAERADKLLTKRNLQLLLEGHQFFPATVCSHRRLARKTKVLHDEYLWLSSRTPRCVLPLRLQADRSASEN